MSSKIVPVIMCGGAGTRLWPASRESMPKQFVQLFGASTLFQETVLRVSDSTLFECPIIITNASYHALVAEQLRALGRDAEVVLEPERRDSAAAVAAAANIAMKRRSDALVLLLASDHAIKLVDKFEEACRDAIASAWSGRIVTFGVVPDHPSTDYGYLKAGAVIGRGKVRALEAFVEKPDASNAERYVAQGYFWNSGNFLFRADVMMEEMKRLQPTIWSAADAAVAAARVEAGVISLAREAFVTAPRISIDYAVMEKTRDIVVLPIEIGWSDLGSWESVWANMSRNYDGNVVVGPCELLNVKNSFVHSDGTVLATVVGLEDIVVVVSGGALLVAPKSTKGEMKTLLEKLKAQGRSEAY